MARRENRDVTIPHATADAIARMLTDYATAQFEHARKTRSETVRYQCIKDGECARLAAEAVTEQLFEWVDC